MLKTKLPLEFSTTVAMNSLALEKRARGERVFNLSAGEPILPPHPKVAAAAKAAIAAGKIFYPPVAGILELREAAAKWMNTSYGTKFTKDNTLITCGGKFGLFAFLEAYLNKGDQVVIVAPYWGSYPQLVKMFAGNPIIIETEEKNGWKISRGDLEKIKAEVKVLILNNAANPTGAVYSREEIQAILAWAKKNDVTVVSDEVYSGLVYDGKEYVSCGSFPEYQDNVVIIQSCSKHFAMTGWRVGLVFAPEETIKVLTMLQSQSTTGTSSVSQWAALAAIENAAEVLSYVRGEMQARRDTMIRLLEEQFAHSFNKPDSSLYAFVSLLDLGVKTNNSEKFSRDLIEKYNIAAVSGDTFGAKGYIRFSFGETKQELMEAIEALYSAIGK